MKNLIKYFGVFAVAASFGLNSMTVNAATTCEEGKTLHTNYYMFLSDDGVSYVKEGVKGVEDSNSIFTLWNGADKYINYPNLDPVEHGYVRIYDNKGGQTTTNKGKEWDVVTFWGKFSDALNNMTSDYYRDTQDGKETYMLHAEWMEYDAGYTGGTKKYHTTDESTTRLKNYLTKYKNSLASSELVTQGTVLPLTYVDDIPLDDMKNSTSKFASWKIRREFRSGVTIPEGTKLEDNDTWARVYSPGAYYIQYCVDDGTTPVTPPPVEPEKEKAIKYDKNTTDTVKDMPKDETYKTQCILISKNYPQRDGYQFLGWSTNKDAKEADKNYAPGTNYCNGKDSITLYAIWKKIETNPNGTYNVRYHGSQDGVKNLPKDQSQNNGSCLNISDQKPTLYKNNFLGWSTVEGAQTPDSRFAPGSEYCGAQGNLDLYAVWQPQTGIGTHFVVFAGAALVAGVALVVAKKKDLFKQI